MAYRVRITAVALELHSCGIGDNRPMPDSFPDLPPALSGPQRDIDGAAGRLRLYDAGSTFASGGEPPLLLIHSVNAAASAFEMAPLYAYYRTRRPVYAIDLPGYGHSDRSDRVYTPRLMTDAVLAATDAIAMQHDGTPIDVIGLSLSSEFVARAATERPAAFRTVTLVAATGLDGRRPFYGPPGSTRGKQWVLSVFGRAPWSGALFRTLTRRGVVRFFLRKTFGRPDVDEGLVDYAFRTAHQPGASITPFYFLSAFLFSADISRVYEAVPQPVLLVHGTRGDFVKYPDAERMARVADWTVVVMETGAMPYYEDLAGFAATYDAFLAARAAPVQANVVDERATR